MDDYLELKYIMYLGPINNILEAGKTTPQLEFALKLARRILDEPDKWSAGLVEIAESINRKA